MSINLNYEKWQKDEKGIKLYKTIFHADFFSKKHLKLLVACRIRCAKTLDHISKV